MRNQRNEQSKMAGVEVFRPTGFLWSCSIRLAFCGDVPSDWLFVEGFRPTGFLWRCPVRLAFCGGVPSDWLFVEVFRPIDFWWRCSVRLAFCGGVPSDWLLWKCSVRLALTSQPASQPTSQQANQPTSQPAVPSPHIALGTIRSFHDDESKLQTCFCRKGSHGNIALVTSS